MYKRNTSFSQIGRTGVGLSATDAAFLWFKRDMQFDIRLGSIVMIRRTEEDAQMKGVPLSRPNPANRPALSLVLAILVKLCGLQSSLTKLFSLPKDRGNSLSVESHEGICINRASVLER
jgi:hypothetical protein